MTVSFVIEMLGTLFVNALKSVAPILVFFLVISALCNAKGGGQMKLVIILYLVGTFIAGAVAVLASTLFPVDLTLSAAAEGVDAIHAALGDIAQAGRVVGKFDLVAKHTAESAAEDAPETEVAVETSELGEPPVKRPKK